MTIQLKNIDMANL